GCHRLRGERLGRPGQPRVGQPDDADVGLDGRERIVGGEDRVLGERVEQRALADVGQPDDADGETHDVPAYRDADAHPQCAGTGHDLGVPTFPGQSLAFRPRRLVGPTLMQASPPAGPVLADSDPGNSRVLFVILFWFALATSVELWWLDTPARSVTSTGEVLLAAGRISGMVA